MPLLGLAPWKTGSLCRRLHAFAIRFIVVGSYKLMREVVKPLAEVLVDIVDIGGTFSMSNAHFSLRLSSGD
jgi:hypothetical protein